MRQRKICKHRKMSGAHGRQELPCNSRVGMSPIGSYVGGLTSKGQVGVLLEEYRGWILRMAFGKNRGATWNRHSF